MKGRNKSQESWKGDHQAQRSCGRKRLDVFKEQQERQWAGEEWTRETRDEGIEQAEGQVMEALQAWQELLSFCFSFF